MPAIPHPAPKYPYTYAASKTPRLFAIGTSGAAVFRALPLLQVARGLRQLRLVRAGLGNGCRVMVVDDDADSRELMLELLEQEGFVGTGAGNGVEAMSLLADGLDPDLVLTDLVMPVMSGWDLCEALKNKPIWQTIPIIVLCGMPPEQRGKLQVDDAFEKPTDTQKLLTRIRELCGI